MFTALILICIGIVIGWNVPQPPWARDLQQKVSAAVRNALNPPPGPGGSGGPGHGG